MLGLIPVQYRLAAALIGIAIVAACSAAGAWTARGWKEDAARLESERQAHARYIEIATAYGRALDAATAARAQDQQQAAADRQAYDRRLRDARKTETPLAVCGTGLDPARPDGHRLPVRFDPAFVRLWDDGLAIGLPATLRAASPDRSGARADLVEPEDLLANVAANGEQCNELRSRLLAVQAWWAGVAAVE